MMSNSNAKGLGRRILPWAMKSSGLIVLLALGFVGVDYGAGMRLILHASPQFLIPAFVIFCVSLAVRMTAWILIASPLKLGYNHVWGYARLFLIGWFASLGLPRGATSLARLAVLASDKGSVGRGMVAIVADRMVEVGVILVLLLISTVYLSAVSSLVLKGLLLGCAILLAVTASLVIGYKMLTPLRRRLLSYGWAASLAEDMSAALVELRQIPISRLGVILAAGTVAMLLTVTSLFLSSRALHIDIEFMVLMAAFGAVALTGLLPISINGLGPREGILTVAVTGAGLGSEGGVALGLLWFLMQGLTRLLAGGAWVVGSGEARLTPRGREFVRSTPAEPARQKT